MNRAKPEAPSVTTTAAVKPAPSESKPAVATEGVVVGHFETKSHRITWLTTDAGPLFSIADLQGAVLASNLTSEEVAQRFPELADFARGGYAKVDGQKIENGILDASGPDDFRNGYVGPD